MSIRCRRRRLCSSREWLKPSAGGALLPLLLTLGIVMAAPARAQGIPPQIPRDGWKDGKRMTYREVSAKGKDADGSDLLRDRLGGLWRRELFVQGNITLTNEANGNRIFVPLLTSPTP